MVKNRIEALNKFIKIVNKMDNITPELNKEYYNIRKILAKYGYKAGCDSFYYNKLYRFLTGDTKAYFYKVDRKDI